MPDPNVMCGNPACPEYRIVKDANGYDPAETVCGECGSAAVATSDALTAFEQPDTPTPKEGTNDD
jgi:hypothetical protein